MSISLPFHILPRIVAVHTAAADKERCSPVLMGVLVTLSGNVATLAATDGKLLIEETANCQTGEDSLSVILSADGAAQLAAWCKMLDKAGKAPAVAVEQKEKRVFFSCEGFGQVEIRCVEGTYPAYASALNQPRTGEGIKVAGINLDYMAAVAKCWRRKGSAAVRMDCAGRGMILSPLQLMSGMLSQRALIMPISLPE